ncbi:DUF3290 family protein [uncultured Weissella sp.]|uniref:DUF3290 family protein n=1 Tax=Weissella viridescens TaxID=1629 RepID=UPI0027DBB539|nr:DUF3290 family protein [uncultured Weissella sp.]
MTFYTIDYIKSQDNMTNIIHWTVLGILVFAGLVLAFMYFKHQHKGRYRDLAILVLLVGLFTIGLQLQNMNGIKQVDAKKSQLVDILNDVAKKENVPVDQIAVDGKTSQSQMLIKAGKKDQYLDLTFNPDMTSYTVAPTEIAVPKDQITVKTGDK